MIRDKKHLEACYRLPSELPARDASIIVDRACQLLKAWRINDADSIAAEFNFPVP